MTRESLKVVIPMAGYGTRLRPHTWSRPKTLMRIAGKTVLDYVLDMLQTLPDPTNVELIFIVGYLGDQFKPYMDEHYPHVKVHYVVQPEMRGQSHAIYLAKDLLSGPMLMVFADTLIETDLGLLSDDSLEAVAWVKPVEDPRRFGVAVVNEQGWVTKLVEKPQDVSNNLVVVGFYYFKQSPDLVAAIEEQMRRDIQLKGEYFLADAINIMLERGLKMRTSQVEVWLDAGVPATMLETNRYLLDHNRDNTVEAAQRSSLVIVPPVYIDPTAQVTHSVIGPHASIGPGCVIENSLVRNSILENEAQVTDAVLDGSLLGRKTRVQGRAGALNVGDNSTIEV
jgi:glucose-1-phosphate thymidylyltransferase